MIDVLQFFFAESSSASSRLPPAPQHTELLPLCTMGQWAQCSFAVVSGGACYRQTGKIWVAEQSKHWAWKGSSRTKRSRLVSSSIPVLAAERVLPSSQGCGAEG